MRTIINLPVILLVICNHCVFRVISDQVPADLTLYNSTVGSDGYLYGSSRTVLDTDSCSATGCTVSVSTTVDSYMRSAWGTQLYASALGLSNTTINIFYTDFIYQVPLNFVYHIVRGVMYARWATSYTSIDGSVFSHCGTTQSLDELQDAYGASYGSDPSYVLAMKSHKSWNEQSYDWTHLILPTKMKCAGTVGYDDEWFCAEKYMTYGTNETFVVFAIDPSLTYSATLNIDVGDIKYSASIDSTMAANTQLDIPDLGTITFTPPVITNPLADQYIIFRYNHRNGTILSRWYSQTMPALGSYAGTTAYTVVTLGSDNLIFDKSIMDSFDLGPCSHTYVTQGIDNAMQYFSDSRDLFYTSQRRFNFAVNQSTPVTTNNQYCCLQFNNPTPGYLDVLQDNFYDISRLSEYDLRPIDNLSYTSGRPDLLYAQFNQLSNGVMSLRLDFPTVELSYKVSDQCTVNQPVSKKLVVYTQSAGSYLTFAFNLVGVSVNVPITSEYLQFSLSEFFVENAGSNTFTVSIKFVYSVESSYTVCLCGSYCFEAVPEYVEVPDGGSDDPHSDDGANPGTSQLFLDFFTYMFTGIISSIVCVLIIILDIIVLLFLLSYIYRVFKNIFGLLFVVCCCTSKSNATFIPQTVLPELDSLDLYSPYAVTLFDDSGSFALDITQTTLTCSNITDFVVANSFDSVYDYVLIYTDPYPMSPLSPTGYFHYSNYILNYTDDQYIYLPQPWDFGCVDNRFTVGNWYSSSEPLHLFSNNGSQSLSSALQSIGYDTGSVMTVNTTAMMPIINQLGLHLHSFDNDLLFYNGFTGHLRSPNTSNFTRFSVFLQNAPSPPVMYVISVTPKYNGDYTFLHVTYMAARAYPVSSVTTELGNRLTIDGDYLIRLSPHITTIDGYSRGNAIIECYSACSIDSTDVKTSSFKTMSSLTSRLKFGPTFDRTTIKQISSRIMSFHSASKSPSVSGVAKLYFAEKHASLISTYADPTEDVLYHAGQQFTPSIGGPLLLNCEGNTSLYCTNDFGTVYAMVTANHSSHFTTLSLPITLASSVTTTSTSISLLPRDRNCTGQLQWMSTSILQCDIDCCLFTTDDYDTFQLLDASRTYSINFPDYQSASFTDIFSLQLDNPDPGKTKVQMYSESGERTSVVRQPSGCSRCKFSCMMSCAEINFRASYYLFFLSPVLVILFTLALLLLTYLLLKCTTLIKSRTCSCSSAKRAYQIPYKYLIKKPIVLGSSILTSSSASKSSRTKPAKLKW